MSLLSGETSAKNAILPSQCTLYHKLLAREVLLAKAVRHVILLDLLIGKGCAGSSDGLRTWSFGPLVGATAWAKRFSSTPVLEARWRT